MTTRDSDVQVGSRPAVTVITPCRNAASHLQTCLDSIAALEGAAVEHIVIDGASDDDTAAILRRWGGRFVSEPDSGQSEALNKGFALASGDIVTWVNADDRLLPSAARTVADFLGANPHVDWVCGRALVQTPDSARLERPPTVMTEAVFDSGNPIPQPACFFRRTLLEGVGSLDDQLHLTMDLDLWYRFLARGAEYRSLDATLAVIEVHADAKTLATPRSMWETEFALVRLRHGRTEAAAETVGRAAAHAAHESRLRGKDIDLGAEIARVAAEVGLPITLTRHAVAAATFENASLSRRGVRKLATSFDPRVLSSSTGRRMLRRSFRARRTRALGRWRHGHGAPPPSVIET